MPVWEWLKIQTLPWAGTSQDSSAQFLNHEVEVERLFAEAEAKEVQRKRQQGLGRPIISIVHKGYRWVAVGSRLFYSKKWKTFHDFLRDYPWEVLGAEWRVAELKKPDDSQHPILRWALRSMEYLREHGEKDGEIYSAPITGAVRAYINLSYNLYLIAHHHEQREEKVFTKLVNRLKDHQNFQGTLYETYVIAAFLKAGFSVEMEDESDPTTSHCEFVATSPITGARYSIEAKARVGVELDDAQEGSKIDNVKRLRIGQKLAQALKKSADHTRVVFIDVNIPGVWVGPEPEGWARAAIKRLEELEKTLNVNGGPAPPSYVFVTNHPYHHDLDGPDVGYQIVANGFKIPDFGVYVSYENIRDYLKAKEKHVDMDSLMQSLNPHYEIPATFDGEMPEFAFGRIDENSRLKFGNSYQIPDENGNEVPGLLYEATIIEDKKECMGVYRLQDGRSIIVNCQISDAELEAYRKSPETFFGVVRSSPTRKVESVIDAFEFLYDSYKDTPKERLLELMVDWSDINQFRELPQSELAITYCERMAFSMINKDSSLSSE